MSWLSEEETLDKTYCRDCFNIKNHSVKCMFVNWHNVHGRTPDVHCHLLKIYVLNDRLTSQSSARSTYQHVSGIYNQSINQYPIRADLLEQN